MTAFDPNRPLIMSQFKTVDGFGVPAGTTLVIVEQPRATGEVTEATAELLFNKKIAVQAEDFLPTPVETPEQERARLAAESLRDAAPVAIEGAPEAADDTLTDDLVPPADLVTWQDDDIDLGKKAGDKVTKEDLLTIALREDIALTDESTKAVIIRQIVEHRAALAG